MSGSFYKIYRRVKLAVEKCSLLLIFQILTSSTLMHDSYAVNWAGFPCRIPALKLLARTCTRTYFIWAKKKNIFVIWKRSVYQNNSTFDELKRSLKNDRFILRLWFLCFCNNCTTTFPVLNLPSCILIHPCDDLIQITRNSLVYLRSIIVKFSLAIKRAYLLKKKTSKMRTIKNKTIMTKNAVFFFLLFDESRAYIVFRSSNSQLIQK